MVYFIALIVQGLFKVCSKLPFKLTDLYILVLFGREQDLVRCCSIALKYLYLQAKNLFWNLRPRVFCLPWFLTCFCRSFKSYLVAGSWLYTTQHPYLWSFLLPIYRGRRLDSFLCPVGGTGVGRQHVWPNPCLGAESSLFPSVHSAVQCLTPEATANRFLKIDVVRYSISSNSELVFLEGKRYSGYKHRALEFQRLLLTYKSCKGRCSYICIVLTCVGCALPPPPQCFRRNGILLSHAKKLDISFQVGLRKICMYVCVYSHK